MPPSARRSSRAWLAATAAMVTGAGLAFWAPALAKLAGTRGRFPVPLDDTFIHFGFARSAALGHPFAWIPENGYSSGGTSLTYPLVLAPGWLLGLRGERLWIFAAFIACASLVDLCCSLRSLAVGQRTGWMAWVIAPLVLAVPLLDWSLFSGMETAFLGAVLGRALVAVHAVSNAPPTSRARAQWRAGAWCAAIAATRPELAPLALLLALAAVHAAGSLATVPSLARASLPVLLLLAAQAVTNRALTGEWAAAGAVRKLATANPYTTSAEVAIEALKNVAALRSQAFEAPLGGTAGAWAVPLLALVAAVDRRTRRLGIPLVIGALASVLLVSLNTTARFQNFRYAAPALVLLLSAAALGAGALARRGVLGSLAAAIVLAVAIVAPARAFPRQIDHFARASANIAGQQVEVAARLVAMSPPPRRVLVGDAGAIPYLSGVSAIDGLGLGGFHGLPFARASVHGVPAVVELIERLPPSERPDVLALYPSWWPGLADVFGRRIDAVRIDDNVICGADEKVLYAADWSSLASGEDAHPEAIDALDVGDLVDERAHAYAPPIPRGGWIVGAVLPLASGTPRFDAGRVVPEGRAETFTLRDDLPPSRDLALVMRTDGEGDGVVHASVERGGALVSRSEAALAPRAADRWHELTLPITAAQAGDRVRILAARGAFRDFHLWLVPRAREAP